MVKSKQQPKGKSETDRAIPNYIDKLHKENKELKQQLKDKEILIEQMKKVKTEDDSYCQKLIRKLKQQLKEKNEKIKELEKEKRDLKELVKLQHKNKKRMEFLEKEVEERLAEKHSLLNERNSLYKQLKSSKKRNFIEEELNKLIVEHEKNIMKATIKAVMSVIDERIEELERSAVLMFDEDLTIDVADEVIRELQQLKKRLEKEV